jgi:hypothetical protein
VYAITPDLTSLVGQIRRGELALDRLVVIEESPDYPGNLLFQPALGPQEFFNRYHAWVSHHLVLGELFNLPSFIDRLCEDGWEPVFGPSCEAILVNLMRWWRPLDIEGYDLHRFQQFSLNRAMETDYWFFNWATGAGKSFCSAAGAKELFDRDQIDLVIAATMSKSKEDLRRFFEHAKLDAVINDGVKGKRRKGYQAEHQVYVMNYEKLWVDYDELLDLVAGLRVLFVFDECHRLVCSGINNSLPNKARRAFEKLRRLCRPIVWPMSASVVNGNPLRFRDVFSLAGGLNPLGTPSQFMHRYAASVKTLDIETRNKRTFPLTVIDWNEPKLTEIRHRVEAYTQAIRKTDPGVREYFRGMQTIIEPVQFSAEEQELADFIVDEAWNLWCDNRGSHVNLGPYYHLLRITANTPMALLASDSEVIKEWAQRGIDVGAFAKISSTKLAKLNEMLESIRESGDKVAVFCHWTNLGIHLFKDQIEVPHVVHWGVGQADRESQRVKDQFLTDPDITCFLTSDAGSHGLNLQVARYVIQLEPLYSYDDAMQRASRIDRADSHLDGLTNYVLCVEDSTEQRVLNIQSDRRILSAATQGTEEVLSYGDRERAQRSEAENVPWLIFGSRLA